ncbi:putative G-protein coupled receptor 33 [Leptodactylus fuscus]|uniref:putative G-protein coupled receptor 33 n=1 Tax=Leptodactylus fuscus TaxID=238119 RepID=UPI003F4E72E5
MVPTNESKVAIYDPEITGPNMISAIMLLITSLFGLVMNTLYIWVLKFRMSQSVNTTWFFHLIITNLIFTLDLPLLAVYVLKNPLWSFGDFMCKVNDTLVNICVHAAAFFLTAISLDRFFLVYFPIWYRKCMTLHRASITCLTMWGAAILFSSPYLVLCHVQQKGNITVCCPDLTFFLKEGNIKKLDQATVWGFFGFHLALSFLLPFGLLSICYLLISVKLWTGHHAKSTRPYKLILIVVASFFICWAPYHVRKGMIVEKGRFPEDVLQILVVLTTCFTCVNSCLTPILYLFIVDSFNKEFRKSVQLLMSLVVSHVGQAGVTTLNNTSITHICDAIEEVQKQQSVTLEPRKVTSSKGVRDLEEEQVLKRQDDKGQRVIALYTKYQTSFLDYV